ncbi:hypothetical protein SASPL_141431 [Salvia splendens]|uniref:START domain-containing protein n=1 Tax=Salvia splendens TaxID=180675 RepID=A0A8X8WQJ0_SALSN|nr:hypothetical protein SASPL_141431 [Salvia splendens]
MKLVWDWEEEFKFSPKMDGYGLTWTFSVLLFISLYRFLSFRRRSPPLNSPSSPAAAAAPIQAREVIFDSDLKNLMEELDESKGNWENLIQKSSNSVSYTAKCCKPKVGVGALKYLSVTTFEDCSVDMVLDFYMDSDYRMEWDKTVVQDQQLQLDQTTATEFGRTVKKFPLLTRRDYMDLSTWCKRCFPGRNACEIRMVHQEDAGLNVEMAKLAFIKRIWSYVCKMDDALRKYTVKKQNKLSPISGPRLSIQKVPAEFEDTDNSISTVDEQTLAVGANQHVVTCKSNKTRLRRMPSSKLIANGLVLLGGAICLSRGHSSLGSKVAMAYLLGKLTKRGASYEKQGHRV